MGLSALATQPTPRSSWPIAAVRADSFSYRSDSFSYGSYRWIAFPTVCHCPDVWAPPELGPWVSNDECGALSTAMFEEFCLPELVDLAGRFGSLGMHCCAGAEHQFESFKRIPGLYAFNRVAARLGYGPLLKHFGGPRDPVQVLGWLSDDQMVELMRGASADMRFVFVRGELEVSEARRWLDSMRELTDVRRFPAPRSRRRSAP